MINTNQFEKLFLLFVLKRPEYLVSVKRGFFKVKEVDLLANITKEYFNKFKKTPSKEQLWMIITTKGLEDKCSSIFFDELFKKKLEDYDTDWIEQTAKSWIKWKNLDSSIIDTVEYIQNQSVTPENVTDIVDTVKDIINSRNNISFDDDLGSSFFTPEYHIRKKEDLLSTNYDFLDKELEGYAKGTLNIYIAPPNTGKSLFMACDAAEYIKSGKNVLFISLEMGAQKILKRIGSNLFNIPINEYDNKSIEYIQKKITEFKEHSMVEPGALEIKNFPISTATVDDIDLYIDKIQEKTGIVYDVLIIDYINILKDKKNPNTENTYLKIKNISEDLRALSQKRNILAISASQTNRSGQDSSDIKLSQIAESAGLSATCDNILAIIQTSEMSLEKMYWLKLLKIRDGGGKGAKIRVDVDYQYMRLRETNTVIYDYDV